MHHAVGVDTHLAEIVFRLECRLFQVVGTEAVGVNNNRCLWLSIAILRLERCRIHCHEHVTKVTGSIDFACSDVYLKSRDTGQRTLRGANVGGIVGKG